MELAELPLPYKSMFINSVVQMLWNDFFNNRRHMGKTYNFSF